MALGTPSSDWQSIGLARYNNRAFYLLIIYGYVCSMTTEEEQARQEIIAMTKKQLFFVDCDKYKLKCCVEGCDKYWNVKDFGVSPFYYIRGKFYDLTLNYQCEKHFKMKSELPLKNKNSIDRLIHA